MGGHSVVASTENDEIEADDVVDTARKQMAEYKKMALPLVKAIASLVKEIKRKKDSAGQTKMIELRHLFQSDEYLVRHPWIFQEGIKAAGGRKD